MAVLGGLTADGVPSAQVDLYDFLTDTWSPAPALPVAVHHAGRVEGDLAAVRPDIDAGEDAPWRRELEDLPRALEVGGGERLGLDGRHDGQAAEHEQREPHTTLPPPKSTHSARLLRS